MAPTHLLPSDGAYYHGMHTGRGVAGVLKRSGPTGVAYLELTSIKLLAHGCPASRMLRRVSIADRMGVRVSVPVCTAVVPNVSATPHRSVFTCFREVGAITVLALCTDSNGCILAFFCRIKVLPAVLTVAAGLLSVCRRLEGKGRAKKAEEQKLVEHGFGVSVRMN